MFVYIFILLFGVVLVKTYLFFTWINNRFLNFIVCTNAKIIVWRMGLSYKNFAPQALHDLLLKNIDEMVRFEARLDNAMSPRQAQVFLQLPLRQQNWHDGLLSVMFFVLSRLFWPAMAISKQLANLLCGMHKAIMYIANPKHKWIKNV